MSGFRVALVAAVVAVALAAASAGPAQAHSTIIGANMGVSFLSSEGSTATVIGVPHNGDVFVGGMRPGLRIGAIADGRVSEVFLDTGISQVSVSNQSFHSIVATANYQHHFSPEATSCPFITGGAGFGHAGVSDEPGVTFMLIGAGVGVRHWLSHGFGATRFEVRYDRLNPTEGGTGTNVVAIKFGFDLVIGVK